MFSISRFQQLMKALPRSDFEAMVREHAANKHDKKFSAWDQMVAMVFGQLSGASSLRQIEAGFNVQASQHYHLRTGPVHRSTLADANNKRCVQVFARAVRHLMGQADRRLRAQVGQLLYVLDSTAITLKGQGFDAWTLGPRTRHIQGLKLHVLYEANSQVPLMQGMSGANVSDIEWALGLPIEPGARYVFDKGYCDYNWWAHIEASGALFVTRFKRNAALVLEQERALQGEGAIVSDRLVRFAIKNGGGGRKNLYRKALRRIEVAREPGRGPLVLATNDLDAPAHEIAYYYRLRWQIELFFKWIKQNLQIKRFVGRSENAVRIQILCALIAYLLLALERKGSAVRCSMRQLLAQLRSALFQRPQSEAELARRRRQRREELLRLQPELPW